MTPSFLNFVGVRYNNYTRKRGALFFVTKTAETIDKTRIYKNKTKIVFTLSLPVGRI